MGLSMENATYAMDRAGMTKLKEDYGGDCDYYINKLKGDKYTAMMNTIDAYWQGADATAFKGRLDAEITALQGKIRVSKADILNCLDELITSFEAFQGRNAGQ